MLAENIYRGSESLSKPQSSIYSMIPYLFGIGKFPERYTRGVRSACLWCVEFCVLFSSLGLFVFSDFLL